MLTTLTLAAGVLIHSANAAYTNTTASWPGWSGLKHLIVFGDSYSQTGFEPTGEQPSPSNPLGNPAYPGSYTSSNGPNWVDFLTTTWNASYLETVNLAYGGATVDADLVKPYADTVISLKQQVNEQYLPYYAGENRSFEWQPSDTLFAVWIGINDVGGTYWQENSTDVFTAIFAEYAGLVDTIYETGARNFLFLNVPPVDRSPSVLEAGEWSQVNEAAGIATWNEKVAGLASNLSSVHADATTFVFDSNALFTEVLDDPSSHPETSAYLNTTRYCVEYENGTPEWDTFYESCEYAVDEYFWLNNLHPTFRIHNATAKAIAQQLAQE
ncbi:Putative GDSL lipase/esterase, SGNH hydrolase superfamily [Septoria linicola]|uniref:GDSL lipase/esterase, SGNH hydrolase superfamily n=1 Tax=Septoria linicola TaxID=215465 RepID=A0A9Q9B6I9_9PEZI|nr:Putative GDSL lipase/esterase, SGNH hydrolase superfamily [Septoria linicola]